MALIRANLSVLAIDAGRYSDAAELIQQSLTAFQRLGDLWLTAYFRVLGMLARIRGDYDEATTHYSESLRLCRKVKDRWVTTEDLQGLALIAVAQRHHERASVLFGVVEKMRQALGVPVYARERGEYEQVVTRARAALGDDPFARASAVGHAMTVDQAIEYALGAEPARRAER